MVKQWFRRGLGIAGLENRVAELQLQLEEKKEQVQVAGNLLTVPADVIGEWLNGRGNE